jgi:YidC/Oxa1 family membrane protein insertase
MSRRARRILIPIVLIAVALGIVLVIALSPKKAPSPPSPQGPQTASPPESQTADSTVDEGTIESPIGEEAAASSGEHAAKTDENDLKSAEDVDLSSGAETIAFTGLRAVPSAAAIDPAQLTPLGSLDPDIAPIEIEFSPIGAGIERITSSAYWKTALADKQARAHRKAVKAGVSPTQTPPLPPDDTRYVLTETGTLNQFIVPAFAAHSVRINGTLVPIFRVDDPGVPSPWSMIAPHTFQTRIDDDDGNPILLITRTYTLGSDGDILLRQQLENLTDSPLDVQFIQYGPGQLTPDRSPYIDIRRFRAAYLPDPANYPDWIKAKDNDQIFDRMSLLRRADKADDRGRTRDEVLEYSTIWPNEDSRKGGFALSWFASTNRYFALAVHPALAPDGSGDKSLEGVVEEIRQQAENPGDRQAGVIFTILYSPSRIIAPKSSINLDLGVYAGPMQQEQLAANPVFTALALNGLILYQMSSFCAICTFQWLAHILLLILKWIHFVLHDWSLAIIVLVIIVRICLHREHSALLQGHAGAQARARETPEEIRRRTEAPATGTAQTLEGT